MQAWWSLSPRYGHDLGGRLSLVLRVALLLRVVRQAFEPPSRSAFAASCGPAAERSFLASVRRALACAATSLDLDAQSRSLEQLAGEVTAGIEEAEASRLVVWSPAGRVLRRVSFPPDLNELRRACERHGLPWGPPDAGHGAAPPPEL